MNYGLYLSASALRVNELRQDVIANNLANVNTASFKRDLAVIRGRQAAPAELNLPLSMTEPVLDRLSGGLSVGGAYTDFSQGPLQPTGGEHDLALDGAGFFAVQSPEGQLRYTRDGRLMRDTDGFLMTVAGRQKLLNEDGEPIRLPAGRMLVDEAGRITVGEFATRMQLVNFEDPQALQKTGENVFAAPAGLPSAASAAVVRQQFVEGSGVEPTKALVDMLTAQRAYDASAKMIKFVDAMLGRAVNDIARIG